MSSLKNALFLALRYMASAPLRTAVLVLGTTVALFLPLFTWLAAEQLEHTLYARAESSPILLGHKGNEFDLVISSLYFRGHVRDTIPMAARSEVKARDYGEAVPLHVKYSAGGSPLVGTSLAYFEQRELELSEGRLPAVLGEVVAGAEVARAFNLKAGDSVRSDMTNLYNISGSYPVMLDVVGVFAASHTPDDAVFFADVKTAWVIDGLFHGHEEVSTADALNPDAAEDENIEASAAIFMFSEISEQNLGSFHLHGSPDEAPLSAVLVFPRDQRAHDQLLGDYALEQTLQAVRPVQVIDTIFGIVLGLRDALAVYFAAVALTTAAFFWLVLSLSLRLRRDELLLMRRLGSSRGAIATIVGAEVGLVILASAGLTAVLTWTGLLLLASATAG